MKTQADLNIATIKNFYKAMAEGKWGLARSLLDPDIDWIEPVAPTLWFSGRHFGADAVFKEVIDPTREKIEKLQLKMKKFYAVGDSVMAIGAFHGWSKMTGNKVNIETIQVWTLGNGKVTKYQGFEDLDAWRTAMAPPAAGEEQRMAA